MNLILSTLISILPPNKKSTVSNWQSFNAPCCHHRGESRDTRGRGGVLITDQGFVYSCFNCGFKAGWQPGKLFSSNTKNLFKWMGLSDYEVGRLGLLTLKLKDDLHQNINPVLNFTLQEKTLPEDCKSFDVWAEENCQDPKFLETVEYVTANRKLQLGWYPWHWCPAPGYNDRLIIPYYQDDVIVGWTGRKITPGKPKYLTESQPGYVFNMDRQTYDRKFVVVVEGILDAIAVDGVAALGNSLNDVQCARITRLNRQVILVPDRDRPGAQMLKYAEANHWSVSLPPWHSDIKDVADAVKRYGRLYTLSTILHYAVHGEIKINLMKKYLENLVD